MLKKTLVLCLLGLFIGMVAGSLWMVGVVDASDDGELRLGALRGRAAFEEPPRNRAESRSQARAEREWATAARAVRSSGPAPIRAHVRDDLGRPLPFLRARAWRDMGSGVREQRTVDGRDGRVSIFDLAPGEWNLSVSARGHTMQSYQVVAPLAEALQVTLARHAVLRGTVVAPGGVTEARVAVTVAAGTRWIDVEDDGSFEIRGVPPGPVSLRARLLGFGETDPLELEVTGGEAKEGLELRLAGSSILSGELLPSLVRAPGQTILIARDDGYPFSTTTTDRDGRFEARVPPGTYRVMLDWRDEGDDWVLAYAARYEVVAEVGIRDEQHVVLGETREGAVVLSGVVRGEKRVPAGTVLQAYRNDHPHAVTAARTSAEGDFLMTLPEPGDYRLAVGTLRGEQVLFDITLPDASAAGVHTVTLELPEGRMRGRVFGPDGEPLAAAQVTLVAPEAPPIGDPLSGIGARSTTTDAQGAFQIGHLGPGIYGLFVHTRMPAGEELLGTQFVSDVVLLDGVDLRGIEVNLDQAATVHGLVADRRGAPIVGAEVHVLDDAGHPMVPDGPALTDRTGGFLIPGVGSGTFRIVAESMGQRVERRIVTYPGGEFEVRLTL